MKKAVVIGGGFGGIAAALRARAKGYDVTLVDRCERLGGRAQFFERDGYRHDAGPTVITAPFLFDELFELFGRKLSDYVNFVPLPLWYRFEFPDGSRFDYGGTADDTLAEIERLSPEDQAGYRQLLKKSEDIYKLGFEQLSAKPFHRLSTMLAQIPAMLKLGHIARFGSWFRGASKTGDYDVPFPFNRCWSVVTPSIPPASTI